MPGPQKCRPLRKTSAVLPQEQSKLNHAIEVLVSPNAMSEAQALRELRRFDFRALNAQMP